MGVSCDSCMKANFRGKRYKCLICYDYDLCATCYDSGATNTRHTTDHPMQCILTRMDFDLYFSGEAISTDQPQAFTCPFCGKMGFTDTSLQEHVTTEHSDTSFEVVCPICASLPGGEPNHVTDDFASHLALDHRSPRDLEEPSVSRHMRRVPHPSRGMSGGRSRRTHMQFNSSAGLGSLSPGVVSNSAVSGASGTGGNARESMDPITELLSQLSGARRATSSLTQQSTTSQLHQLQMQLQLERQHAQAARQQLERLPRRQGQVTSSNTGVAGGASVSVTNASSHSAPGNSNQSHYTILLEPSPSPASNAPCSQFLLSRCTEPTLTESEQKLFESERLDRSLFIQELILSTLSENLPPADSWDTLALQLGQITMDGSNASPALSQAHSHLQGGSTDSSSKSNQTRGSKREGKDVPSKGPSPSSSSSQEADTSSSQPETPSDSSHSSASQGGCLLLPQAGCGQQQPVPSQVTNVATTALRTTANQNIGQVAPHLASTPSSSSSSSMQQVMVGGRARKPSSNPQRASVGRGIANASQLGLPPQQQQPQQHQARNGLNQGPGSVATSQRALREGLSLGGAGSRAIGRNAGGGTSPSSTRRKVPRQVDERNKSSEPPPPH